MKRKIAIPLATLLVAIFTGAADASTWTGGTQNWSSNGNPGWNGTGVPNAQGASGMKSDIVQAVTTQDIAAGVTVGTLSLGGSSNISWTFTLTNSITFDQDGAGAGVATISNTNSNVGIANALILGNAGTQTITLADDLLISNSGGSTAGNGAIQIGAKISGTGNITLSSVSNSTSAGFIRIQTGVNNFTGTVLVQKGATTFNNASSFGGVSTNTITLGQSGQGNATLISTAGFTVPNNIIVASGSLGTLILGSNSTSNGGYSGTITLNGDLSLTSASTVGTNTLTFSNAISGAGSLTKIGTGSAQLSGSNTFMGDTILAAGNGALVLNNTNALQNSTLNYTGSALTFNSAVATHAFTFGGLTGSANIALQDNAGTPNSVALSVGNNNSSPSAYSGILSGAGSLTKIGNGTLTLSGPNTYTGVTNVNAGTLLINGNQSSATNAVSVSGTLGGIGTIGGTTTVNSGGTITGATNGTIGTLHSNNKNVIIGSNGTYLVDIGGITSDSLALGTGGLNLSASGDIISFNQVSSLSGTSYTLATYSGVTSTFDSVMNLPTGYQLSYGATELDLVQVVAVPEPGTWLAASLAFASLLIIRLQRHAQTIRVA